MPHVERPDGARIHWEAEGPEDGPVVLLVQGLGYPGAMWFRLVPALAERHRVVRLDNRGAGRTGDVPGAPYTVETMAADCVAVLDAAGAGRAHVAGASMGGLVAMEVALSAPERVASLVLACTHPGLADAVLDHATLALLAQRGQMSAREAAEASIPINYAPTTPRERIEEDWAVRLPLAATQAGYLAQVQGTSPWRGLSRLGQIAAPTLVVHGEDDRLLPVANARLLAERIPGAELVTIPDANHVFWTDQPERSREVLLDWLARQG